MNLTLTYQRYLEDKLNDPDLVSQVEHEAFYCCRHLGAKDDFMLIIIRQDCIETYQCNCSDRKGMIQMGIDDMDQYPFSFTHVLEHVSGGQPDTQGWNAMFFHNGQRFEYDTYYDQYLPEQAMQKITGYMTMIPQHNHLPAFVMGEHTDFNMLMFALQGRFANLSVIPSHSNDDSQPTYILPEKLNSDDVRLSVSGAQLGMWLNKWSTPIAVPLDRTTINSSFWLDRKWKDVLPELQQPDARVAGTNVKYISFKTQTDGYRNIFLTAKAIADGTEKTTRLHSFFE